MAQLVKHTRPACCQFRFDSLVRQGIFLPVNFLSADSYGVNTPLCAITCINICAHVKDPGVHVRIQWILETLIHPACTVDWVARLLELAFSRGSNLNFSWEKFQWDNAVVKYKKRKNI